MNTNVTPTVDVRVANEGTVFAFELLTDSAFSWVKEHVSEPMFLGHTLVVEHRYAEPLADGMIAGGLEVE